MDSLMRICLLMAGLVVVFLPLSLQIPRAYSLIGTKDNFLQFSPQCWQTGEDVEHLSFRFKTHNPEGLLVFVNDGAVVVRLTDGHIEVFTSAGGTPFSDHLDLANDEWHELDLVLEIATRTVKLNIDGKGFIQVASNVIYEHTQHPAVYVGGVDKTAFPDLKLVGFRGCLDDLKFAASSQPISGEPDQGNLLEPKQWEEGAPVALQAAEGCQDACLTDNPCRHEGRCRQRLDGVLTCDCSLTDYEGSDCSVHEASVVSLDGSQIVTFDATRAAPDAVKPANRIALNFKTNFSEGVLLLVDIKGESPGDQADTLATVSLFVAGGKYLHWIVSTPDQAPAEIPVLPLNEAEIVDSQWHSLVLQLEPTRIKLTLDDKIEKRIGARGGRIYRSFGKELFLGGVPASHAIYAQLVAAFNSVAAVLPAGVANFVGCLRRAFYGPVNILEGIRNSETNNAFISSPSGAVSSPTVVAGGECANLNQRDLAITLLSEETSVIIPHDGSRRIDVKLEFRLPPTSNSLSLPATSSSTLLSGQIKTEFGDGDFRIFVTDRLNLEVNYKDDSGAQRQFRALHPTGVVADGNWHSLRLLWPTQQDQLRRRRQDADVEIAEETTAAPEAAAIAAEVSAADIVPVAGGERAAETNDLPSDPTDLGGSVNNTAPEEVESSTDLNAIAASAENNTGLADGSRIRAQFPLGRDEATDYRPPGVDARSTLTIEIDGQKQFPGAMAVDLMGSLVLGRGNSTRGFAGCVRGIQDHSFDVDPRRLLTESHGPPIALGRCNQTIQSCQENNLCHHGSKCTSGIVEQTCNCTTTGYTGRTCHIPLYAQTCADLYLSGERLHGYHLIDLDGSGPLPPVHVYCNMSQEAEGATMIFHNFKPINLGTGKAGGVKYEIKYQYFDRDALRRLVDISPKCKQFASFKCKKAPLRLGSHTWFETISNQNFTGFGSNTPLRCNCAIGGSACGLQATPDLSCNCDADDNTDRVDEGYFSGNSDFVGITKMTFVNRPIGGSGEVSLGPLICSGKKQIEPTVSFSANEASLPFPTLTEDEDLSFFFKTALNSTTLLYQPSVGGSSSFRISVINATTLSLFISINGRVQQLSVTSRKVLTNRAWHSVKVQFGFKELRFTVDLNSQYLAWGVGDRVGQYMGPLYFGGYPKKPDVIQAEPGLIGCMRGFFRDSKFVDVEASAQTAGSPDVLQGCLSACTPNPCKNNAECVDKINDFDCICSLAQSRKTCDIDINDKAVTFETANSTYIRVTTLDSDVFRHEILVSFRTHIETATLLYAHDNLHNFIQLHLDHGREILFTFNNGDRLKQVSARTDKTFNDGKWHQIHVKQEPANVTLTVDYVYFDAMELRVGRELLSTYSGRPFGRATGETIIPPRPAHAMRDFRDLYIGGVTEQFSKALPGFHGCLRGLKIGHQQFFPLQNEPDPDVPSGVSNGCLAGCDSARTPCGYSGRCINHWGNTSHPVDCDCSGTSYNGPTCTEDVGVNLDGSSQLIVEYATGNTATRALDLSRQLSFTLAFSTAVQPIQDVALVFIQTYRKVIEMVIGLNRNGDITVDLFAEDSESVHQVIEGNFTDGQRHFASVQTWPDHIIIEVGKQRKDVHVDLQSALPAFVHMVSIGGIKIPVNVKHQEQLDAYANFSGCISNVRIGVSDEPKLLPLEPLKVGVRREQLPYILYRFTETPLNESQCAAPFLPLVPTGLPPTGEMETDIKLPDWNVPPSAPEDHVYTTDSPKTEAHVPLTRNTGIIVGVICGIFLLAVLIGVLIYVRRLKRNKKNNYTPQEVNHEPAASDALLTKHEPNLPDEIPPLSHREKIRPVANAAFVRPVTNYIDETIIPNPSARARELEKQLDGSNGSSLNRDQK